MRKNTKKILTIILLVLVMALSFVLVACDNLKFEYPALPTGSGTSSNGGSSVVYGDYLYFVNGVESDNTATNKYTGEVKVGDICRIKLVDMVGLYDFKEENKDDDDFTELMSEEVFDKAEVVVPMFYYSNNSTQTELTGLYIFGDTLYFTTPNQSLSTGGAVLNNQISIYSCKLDGKNLTKIHTLKFDSLSTAIMLVENGGYVYAMYVDEDSNLVYIDLSSAKNEAVTVRESVSSVKYQWETKTAIFIDDREFLDDEEDDPEDENPEYKSICSYTLLGEVEILHQPTEDDRENESYTITQVSLYGGEVYVYFTIANSEDFSKAKTGLFMVKSGSEAVRIALKTSIYTSFLAYYDKLVVVGERFSTTPQPIELFVVENDMPTDENITFILPQNTNKSSITLLNITSNDNGDNLRYVRDGKEYTFDLKKLNSFTQEDIIEQRTTLSATSWAQVDEFVYDGVTYFVTLTNGGVSVSYYTYNEKEKENELVSIDMTVVQPEEEE